MPNNEYGPKGDGVLFEHEKAHEKQPDHRGNIDITRAQLHALVELAKESNDGTFKLQVGAWNRTSEKGDPYMYLSTEVYQPRENSERQEGTPYRPKEKTTPRKKPWER